MNAPTDEQIRAIWERLATFWDKTIGEGNEFQLGLIEPATDRLLRPQPGQSILEIACGNGQYSRKLGRRGVRVLATDFCAPLLDAARARTSDADGSVVFQMLDATDARAIRSLGEHRFNAAVCNMALMDFARIEPLLQTLPSLLKVGGAFVFSVPHPCFNSGGATMTAALTTGPGMPRQEMGVQVKEYIRSGWSQTQGILHQPEPHYIAHRPMSELFRLCFEAGWVIDGLEEPTFPEGSSGKNAFSWKNRPLIPPAIVVRVRHGMPAVG